MRQKRVLIVDDSATIRQIIRARVAQDPRLVVVGEAGDPELCPKVGDGLCQAAA